MWNTTSKVCRFINRLEDKKVFTTRDLLALGEREDIDKILSGLVKHGQIERVAQGIFCLPGAQDDLTPVDVAIIKAESFGKKLVVPPERIQHIRRAWSQGEVEKKYIFYTDGYSTAFKFRNCIIQLKQLSARKMQLGTTKAAQTVMMLWNLGEGKCTPRIINEALLSFNRADKEELKRISVFLPDWLGQHFRKV